MIRFKTTVQYGDQTIEVEADDLAELHKAVARMQELHTDAKLLRQKTNCQHVALRFYTDKEGNDYFGFRDEESRANISFGRYKEKQTVPFFPKGDAGYFAPNAVPDDTTRELAEPPQRVERSQQAQSQQRSQKAGPPIPPIEAYEN